MVGQGFIKTKNLDPDHKTQIGALLIISCLAYYVTPSAHTKVLRIPFTYITLKYIQKC